MLCGDEVGSVVCDIGGAWSKFGSAGEDSPHHVFKSDIGYIEEEMTQGPGKCYRVGDNGLRVVRENMEVENPYSSTGKSNAPSPKSASINVDCNRQTENMNYRYITYLYYQFIFKSQER